MRPFSPGFPRCVFSSGAGLLAAGTILCGRILAADEPTSPPPARHSPDEVLLVVNTKSPVSAAIGAAYAAVRQIKNIVQVECPDSALSAEQETIAFADYQRAIERPVRDFLSAHPSINFIVLTKGIPIRLRGGTMGNAWDHGKLGTPTPALDSTLAALDYETIPDVKTFHFAGTEKYAANGDCWANRYYDAHEPFSHAKFGGYLVTRLDGYTQKDANALVVRALAAEASPPKGPVLLDIQPKFGIDDIHSQPAPFKEPTMDHEAPWGTYNADLAHAGEWLKTHGIPVLLDQKPEFVGDQHNLAGYFSWGSNDAKFKAAAYLSLTFAPGALSDTAVSTSARTFLPTKGGQTLMTDLIAHGLTGAKGYTDEPYLQAMASPTITVDRYFSGYTLAESLYAGSHLLGWEDIVIGDPLCAPFRKK